MTTEGEGNDARGLRTICSLGLRDVEACDGSGNGPVQLEPGDMIFGRATGNWLSRVITDLDGYWSHSAIYVGGGEVAHAYSAGVHTMALTELAGYYPDGMGMARPGVPEAQRRAAADWAREIATSAGPFHASYSGRDLGMAWALLRRVRASAADALPDPDDAVDRGLGADVSALDDGLERIEIFESTCSGFVFRAYDQVGDSVLSIVPAPGIELVDGLLRPRDEPDLWTVLTEPAERSVLAPASATMRNWAVKAEMMADALKGWLDSQDQLDEGIPLAQGVTPADLWCSPTVSHRLFFTEHHRQVALAASADCG